MLFVLFEILLYICGKKIFMIEILFLILIVVTAYRKCNKPTLDDKRYPGPPWVSNNRR